MQYYPEKKRKNHLIMICVILICALGVFQLWRGGSTEVTVENKSEDQYPVEEIVINPPADDEQSVEADGEIVGETNPAGYIEACQFSEAAQPWLRGILLDEVSGKPIEVPNVESPGQVQVWVDSRAQGLSTPILAGGCFDFEDGLTALTDMGYDIYSVPLVLEISYGDPFAPGTPNQTILKEIYAQEGQDLELVLYVPSIY